ncbi:hypothetical protein MAPG_04758 [Magnaporthiopsis poae ATCC 64411]|uniref:Amine oxidase domain-containing protein n=1 Tax=Magnaporthiopsis poae (strain ATCC 64411 / 73-15) TaxID=644358 RepID=A0A0C4DXK4_MAGP6|nr:hypothetical protein MAPG_04758 [Magnaporthiopsis poae ATCC 64411]
MKSILVAGLLGQLAASSPSPAHLPVEIETRTALDSHLANIHLSVRDGPAAAVARSPLSFTYGSCAAKREADAHHVIARSTAAAGEGSSSSRLVWRIPADAQARGCISAWDAATGALVGRSAPQEMHAERSRRRRRSLRARGGIHMNAANGFDVHGPWFDGVALLKGKNLSAIDVEKAKAKKVGIVGAGMSGLMTYLVLSQAGFKNLEIIEASKRLGGRVHTTYLSGGPFDYSYQEMGPMRFPKTIELEGQTLNITDHQMVFDLAAELNRLNRGNPKNLTIDWIPWYQSAANSLIYNDDIKTSSGIAPTQEQIDADPSLMISRPKDPSTIAAEEARRPIVQNHEFMAKAAKNLFRAHSEFIKNGVGSLPGPGDRWSEFAFMVNYLKLSLNDTSILAGEGSQSFWTDIYDELYFSAATWSTIDGGLNRLPQAFEPLVKKATTFGRKIERVRRDAAAKTVTLQWRDKPTDAKFKSSTYDFAVVGVPFSVVKQWRFSPRLDTTITNAMRQMPYADACKVALEFKERFWERRLPKPIYGGCSTMTDIPGIGTICYPSYNINGTGPASILGSYIFDNHFGSRFGGLSEAEHVQYVLDAILEIHGPAAAGLYTGKYDRVCWEADPLQSGSWAEPTVGQHELFIPEYFKTHDGVVFVGEHTSYTHGWIASAIESALRGSVQLLLELGLVDEAKAVVEKWMARWIEI